MSQETRKAAEHAKQHLGFAENSLKDAEAFAEKSGDKKMAEKIKSNRKEVEKTKKDLEEKLSDSPKK